MIGTGDIEVHAGDVGAVAGVLMSLKEKMAAVIVTRNGPTRVVIEDEIGIFVRLGTGAVAEIAVLGDEAGGILEQLQALHVNGASEFGRDDVIGDYLRVRERNAGDAFAE